MRIRNNPKVLNTTEQDDGKRSPKLSVVKRRKGDQRQKGGAVTQIERSSDDNEKEDATDSNRKQITPTRDIDVLRPSSSKGYTRIRRMNIDKVDEKEKDTLIEISQSDSEKINEDFPMMPETEIESPDNYLALARLAQVTWMQDPFRVRRHLFDY